MRIHRARGAVAATVLLTLVAADARAGGMFLPARGARPLGRAGSFVAGADDLESLYYNPAGLAETGRLSLMLDAGLVFQSVDYDRVDSGGSRQSRVSDDNGLLPLPFLGISFRPDALGRRVTFALGLWAPYTGIARYPMDGPQRYSLGSLDGTAVAIGELAASIRVTPSLYVGLGVQNMYLALHNTITLSACTGLNCAPEDKGFDTATQARVASAFNPSGNVGLIYLTRFVRLGASFQGPFFVHASGKVKTRLPSDPQFDGAVVVGDDIDVDINFPWILRAGVEVRPLPALRVELGADYEAWDVQDKISFAPRNVYIDHVTGVGRYVLHEMTLDRSMQPAVSVHLGGEYDLFDRMLTVRAGYLFESSAVPDETLTVLTPDGNKHLVSLGASLRLGRVRLDAGYGHFFQPDRTVTTSRSYQLQPIRPPLPIAVGNGTYHVATDVISLGVEGRF